MLQLRRALSPPPIWVDLSEQLIDQLQCLGSEANLHRLGSALTGEAACCSERHPRRHEGEIGKTADNSKRAGNRQNSCTALEIHQNRTQKQKNPHSSSSRSMRVKFDTKLASDWQALEIPKSLGEIPFETAVRYTSAAEYIFFVTQSMGPGAFT